MKQLRLALCILITGAPLGFAQVPVTILFDGNSWVAGSGSTAGSNFPNQVRALLQKADRTVTLLNTGVPGQTIDKMQLNAPTQVDSQAKAYRGLVALELVNQWGQTGDSREKVYAKYQKYFLDRQAAGFKRLIALTPIAQGYYPRKHWEADRQWFIQKMLTEFPKLGIVVANVGGDPRLSDWNDTTYFATDKIHPNNAGYSVMAEIVAKTLLNSPQLP